MPHKPYKKAPFVDTLAAPPVVGKEYRVRCLLRHRKGTDKTFWLPIIGAAHTDAELGVSEQHYHPDFRFVSRRLVIEHFGVAPNTPGWERRMGQIEALTSVKTKRSEVFSVVRVLLRRCVRPMPTFPEKRAARLFPIGCEQFPNFYQRGKTRGAFVPVTLRCERLCDGKRIADISNPVCPHRGFPLASLSVDADGCVTCPGHGLRWSLRSGELVSRYAGIPGDAMKRLLSDKHKVGGYRR